MIFATRAALALVLALLAGCSSGEGEIRVAVAHREPPAWMQMPRSIGGYAFFVDIVGPEVSLHPHGITVAYVAGGSEDVRDHRAELGSRRSLRLRPSRCDNRSR